MSQSISGTGIFGLGIQNVAPETAILGQGALFGQSAVSVTNTMTPTALGITATLSAGFLSQVDRVMRVTGYLTVTAAIGSTLTIDLRLGSTVIASLAALPVGGLTSTPVEIEALLISYSAGIDASTQAILISAGGGQTKSVQGGPGTIDLTPSLVLDLYATWSTASSSDVVSMPFFEIEVLQ